MSSYCEGKSDHKLYKSPCFGREAPDLELERVVLYLLNIFDLHPRFFTLQITLAMPVVESKHVVGARCKDHVALCVLRPPDFIYDMISELTLEEGLNLKLSDQVKSISVLEIFIQ